MKLLASLLTAAALAAPVFSAYAAGDAPKAAKPDLVKGEASYTAVCAACHGADGNSAIAANPNFAKDKTLVSLGERIYRGGIADRQIAACAGCHSPNGAGIPAQYPRLSGQHADYTVAQLNTFRDGSRANSTQMTQVAAKLNDKEIKAVADYIAGLR